MFREQPAAGRVNRKVARRAAHRGLMFDEREPAGFLVHRKNGDAVVPAIRAVEKFPVWMQRDFGGSVVRRKILRQRGNGLHLGHRRVRGGVAEHGDRAAHFIDDVNEFSIMRKNQMARAGAGCHGRKRRFVRSEFGIRRVEVVYENLVQTEIAIEREAVVRRRQNEMRMRPGLTFWIRAGAGVLNGSRRFTQTAIGVNRQRGDAARAVICDHQAFACGVHGDMARAAAAGKLLVQQRELAGFGFKGKGAHRAGLAHFTDRIKIFSAGRHGEEGRILGFSGEFRRAQLPSGGIKFRNVNSLALRASVGAEINQRLGGETGERPEQAGTGQKINAFHAVKKA